MINLAELDSKYQTAEAPVKKEKRVSPDGTYEAKITEAGWFETRTDNKPYFGMTLTISSGDFKGEKNYKKCFIATPYGLSYLKKDMEVLGVKIEKLSEFDPFDLIGMKVVYKKVTGKPNAEGKSYPNYYFVKPEEVVKVEVPVAAPVAATVAPVILEKKKTKKPAQVDLLTGTDEEVDSLLDQI